MISAMPKPSEKKAPIRVMVVDDSAAVRGLIARILQADPGIEVVATCSNGQMAVLQASRLVLDVIILDVEMPVMDGLTAVPKLLAANPAARIIMASALTQRNASVSLEALALGATDCLAKPSTIGPQSDFQRQLVEKVVALGTSASRSSKGTSREHAPAAHRAVSAIKLRQARPSRPQVLVIGSSTGGPQALIALLRELPRTVTVPIMIAQHMPATFTGILAQHIERASGRPCAEAAQGAELKSGHIYLAPGNFHLEIARDGSRHVAHLTQAPPENFCRPSVNPLFRSAAHIFGADACAVMLTGMGSDGLDGTRELAAAGAPVIAQDEATCVVWGMPGAIATAGLCTAVLALNDIAPRLATIMLGGRA